MREQLHTDLAEFLVHNAIVVLGVCVAMALWFIAMLLLGL